MKRFFMLAFLSGSSIAMMAQPAVQSGSFQFTCPVNLSATLTLDGPQYFQDKVNGSLILSNALPGDYLLSIDFAQRGRVQSFKQTIRIEPARRVCFNFTDTRQYNTTTQPDGNSILLYESHRDHSHVHPVDQADFEHIVAAVKKENFDNEKYKTMELFTGYYPYFTTEQVKQLAQMFSFEDKKLDCVKYLLPKITDVENLPSLANIFSFKSTKDSYLDYLRELQKERRP